MKAVCDVANAGDEQMYRLSEKKLLTELIAKAKSMSGSDGLPESMEEAFVRKVLQAPLLTQKRTMTVVVTAESTVSSTPARDSQSTTVTSEMESLAVTVSTTAPAVAPSDTDVLTVAMTASDEVLSLQRLKVAFNFICIRYVPPALAKTLQEMLADAPVSGIDFAPLRTYLEELTKARAEAHAARCMGDYALKRGNDDEAEEARAAKKRKAEEDKKKKNTASRGVKELKNVDTSGMKKLTSFFTKKA
jgi:hypothetical protein